MKHGGECIKEKLAKTKAADLENFNWHEFVWENTKHIPESKSYLAKQRKLGLLGATGSQPAGSQPTGSRPAYGRTPAPSAEPPQAPTSDVIQLVVPGRFTPINKTHASPQDATDEEE